MLAGCFEGFVYVMDGTGSQDFAKPRRLKDRGGKDVHLGEFWDYENKKWGEAKVNGEGDLGIHPELVDWDGDGDLDLLMGGYRGIIGVRLNHGSPTKPKFSEKTVLVKAGDKHLNMSGGVSFEFADWNGDGKKDLICANSKGTIAWYENTADEGAPVLKEAQEIFRPDKKDPKADQPAHYLKLNAADYNGDGKPDLIVGAGSSDSRKPGMWVFLRK